MPPQGESTGFAIEDAMLFTRIMKDAINSQEERGQSTPDLIDVKAVFTRYERNRRARIDTAYEESNSRWDSVKDKGWLASVMMDWMTWLYLWFTQSAREKSFTTNVKTMSLVD
jgi:salicylate hydroxylase